jgi:hypothetical protein
MSQVGQTWPRLMCAQTAAAYLAEKDLLAHHLRVVIMNDNPRRRTPAAQYLRERRGIPCSPGTLANYAVSGTGRLYWLAGRFPVYAEADHEAWALGRLSGPRRNTSQVMQSTSASATLARRSQRSTTIGNEPLASEASG